MKTRPNIVAAVTCVAALSFGLSAKAQNLLTDPGFESGGVSSPWNTFNGAAFSQDFAQTGSWSMLNNGPGGFTVPGAFQILPTTAGAEYDLTGFGLTPTAPGAGSSFGILQITFFSGVNGTGGNLGTIDVSNGNTPTGAGNAQGSQQINSASQTGVWIPLDTGIAQAPTGSQSLEVFTLVVDQNPTKVYFDNLDLTQVPEPSTFALFALTGAGLYGRLRRGK
jgi:hypothetical protein